MSSAVRVHSFALGCGDVCSTWSKHLLCDPLNALQVQMLRLLGENNHRAEYRSRGAAQCYRLIAITLDGSLRQIGK